MSVSNTVQLITYPDSFGRNLNQLHHILVTYFPNAIKGVHILPLYPSTSDRGFSPKNFSDIDPRFGAWADLEKLCKDFDVTTDLIVNHISASSQYFLDYLKHGKKSQYYDMFVHIEDLGVETPTEIDFTHIYTRKPRMPLLEVEAGGKKQYIWNTFSEDQIDLNVHNEKVMKLFYHAIHKLIETGVDMIRLDAAGYVIKKLGSNCFFVEPEMENFLKKLQAGNGEKTPDLLLEVHEKVTYKQHIEDLGYWSYDFSLPLLVLHAIYFGNCNYLAAWIRRSPKNQITTLDTHDGIGIVDAVGAMPDEEIEKTRSEILKHGGSATFRASGTNSKNLDVYQVNCTFYSALGKKDSKYLLARAIQMFTPGIPQVYYVGLLAGKNNDRAVKKSQHGRDINRYNYREKDIESNLQRPVVRNLLRLLELRNTHVAFEGKCNVLEIDSHNMHVEWVNKGEWIRLEVDFSTTKWTILDKSGKIMYM
jgi:sucrose phosphorylase